jgi:D-proline reductase (dithiol) PrdB
VRVALRSAAQAESQEPFHFKDDTSIRTIPSDTPSADLRVAHFGYPIDYARADPNCVFPIDRMRELAAEGIIGELAPSAVTFMGGIYSQRRVRDELVPAVLDALRDQNVDLFYIVPA